MQLNVAEAHQLAVRIMLTLGHDAADAGLIADHLIDCELRGLSYGGLARDGHSATSISRQTRAPPMSNTASISVY